MPVRFDGKAVRRVTSQFDCGEDQVGYSTEVDEQVLTHLRPLVGLKLAVARRAADLRNFQFGHMRAVDGGTLGEWALHVQCPWRIEGPDGNIVTGRSDLWEPRAEVGEGFDWKAWDYEKDGNLQDERILALLGGSDEATRSAVNVTDMLVVEGVRANACGGATLLLSGGYTLTMYPAGARGEDWRIFRPGTDGPHFVISGGKVDADG